MKTYDVLIVEDDAALGEALCDTLELAGYQAQSAAQGAEALTKLAKHHFRLVISDVQMPVMDGLSLLQTMQTAHSEVPVILMTAYGTIPKAVEAMRLGALDYLVKPFEADALVRKVANAIGHAGPVVSTRVVNDAAMRKLYALAAKVAKTDVTVLLQGESGTGKEVIARYLHEQSKRSNGPFVAVNCAAIPENMLEAMLFGYEKGAFTGAVQAMPGKFEQAQGGTLLLDEISEMDLALQAKLLRVLQEREVERLGGQRKIALDVRILATTNRHLRAHMEAGEFREDLYYRLNVFPLHIPALRERPADIVPIAECMVARHWQSGKPLPVFSGAALAKLQAYAWPGNVRELENVIQRALVLHSDGRIEADDLILENESPATPEDHDASGSTDTNIEILETTEVAARLQDNVRSIEEKVILQTLREARGCRKEAAEQLGISPRTLRYKLARMKASGLAVPA